MLVEEVPRSFVKKNNNYSHCPLKKRPVHMLDEEVSEVKEEIEIDVVMDDIPEPENLSTKPEDLSKTAERNNQQQQEQEAERQQEQQQRAPSKSPSPIPKISSSPPLMSRPTSPTIHGHIHPVHHIHHHHHYPTKVITPPVGIAPIHPVAKKARVEVIQHDNSSSTGAVTASAAPLHFMASKPPLEPLNLNTPVDSLPHYAAPAWARTAPLYPPHYLPYPAAYHRYHPAGAELYPSYPMPAYPHSSPEHHQAVSPPPHTALTCPTIQRPIARSYAHWASPDHCGLSPTSSLGSGSLRSPPPVTPEDLSSPGSDSGRSSAGSTSAGSAIVHPKIEKSGVSSSSTASSVSSNSSSSSSSSSSTSPRYQCPDCGKSYSTYSGLSKHQQFHCAAAEGQAKKSFSCKYCEKVYVSLGALKMHIRTHTLPCKCHLCGKAFSRPWLLQGHIRTHTGEKPFSCQHCNRAFADRSNLRAHLQTHSDVKKYSCTSCSKTFSRMSLLTKHQEGGCPGITVPMGYGS
ncbi:LOW QUALITY PROTEIN: protein escargot-like [Apis florea]|uniref:LOW QUALITY PROTEIN: protein escargot-like n=1 Tax=Apis florea TaxID=7463 RepID=UPI0006296A45|nr:LOW QUALITY PROTEIN: protein escargot-like [Apis florea]